MTDTVHDLGALRALREVGRHGSIAAAASVLGVSQQALSGRMRTLERAMGVTLLARSPSGSHLTEQGRLVVGWAEDVLDAADRLEGRPALDQVGGVAPARDRRQSDDRRAPCPALAGRAPQRRASRAAGRVISAGQLGRAKQGRAASGTQTEGRTSPGRQRGIRRLSSSSPSPTRPACSSWSATARPGSASSRPRICRRTWSPGPCATTSCSWSPPPAIRGHDVTGRWN